MLPQLFQFMQEVSADETILFSKIDLSDDFWQMMVSSKDAWHFCFVLPDARAWPSLIVIPLALQMGWCESPAYFCATTKTARDIG